MSNISLVEGPWGKYTFRLVRPQDYDKVIKHVQDFFCHHEPMSKLLGYTDQYGKEFGDLTRSLFKDNMSFWVEDNETGNVVAVRVTFRHTRDFSLDGIQMTDNTFKTLFKFFGTVDGRLDLFEHYDIDEYADFFLASCDPKYRRQGITTEMYKRSLKFLAAEGFKMAKSVFNSPYTRAAARNLGFEEVVRVYFHEMKDENGKPIFNKKDLTEEHYGSNICKRL